MVGITTDGREVEPKGRILVLVCESGHLSASGCDIVAERLDGAIYTLEGGTNAWCTVGGKVVGQTRSVLSGVGFSFGMNTGFFANSGLVGAGLIFAVLSRFCGMARLLAFTSWNQWRMSATSA